MLVVWNVLKVAKPEKEGHYSHSHWFIVGKYATEHGMVKAISWFLKELLQRVLPLMTKLERFSASRGSFLYIMGEPNKSQKLATASEALSCAIIMLNMYLAGTLCYIYISC